MIRQALVRLSLAIAILFVALTSAKAQQPTPTPRSGRSYSADELPKTPPPAGPKGQSPMTFTDITAQTRINFKHQGSPTSVKYLLETMGGGVAIFDYDNDGRMDLFFTNGALLKDPMPKVAMPDKNDPSFWNRLYHQKADGTFEDVTDRAGLKGDAFSMGVAAGDYDNDGYVDLYVTGYGANHLYHNKGDGTFEDIGVSAGEGYDEDGKTFAGMGVDVGDYDNDGYPDVFITTLSYQTYALYHNNGDLSFTYATKASGVGQITLLNSGWGTHFIDADNDGLRDIFVAQSHVLDTIEKSTGYLKYKQTPLLMRNMGKGFVDVSATAGPALNLPIVARGAAFGDLNNDGQVDVVVGVLDGSPLILRNNGTKNHWLGIRLVGSKSNRDGSGARVVVTDTNDRRQIFDVSTAGSYLSSSDSRTIAGLGPATVKNIEVHWPSGLNQSLTPAEIDSYLTIYERDAKNGR